MRGKKELTLDIGDFNGHVGKNVDGFEGKHKENEIGDEIQKIKRCWNSVIKKICVTNRWFKKKEKRKVTYSSGGNKTEIDFTLVEKEIRKFLKDVKLISWKLQHRLVVVDVKKRII